MGLIRDGDTSISKRICKQNLTAITHRIAKDHVGEEGASLASFERDLHKFIGDFPHIVVGEAMPNAVLDDRGRIVLPKDVADELGVSRGDAVVLEKRGREFVVMKALSKTDRLEEIMDWNPKRSGKVERVSPRVMKEIWKT